MSFHQTQTRLNVGDTLQGNYRVEKEIGSGGLAVVYLATDLLMDVPVAIKRLKVLPNAGYSVERFVREARMQARLVHQNIVGIRGILEEKGRYYIVMEYIDGDTMSSMIRRSESTPCLPLDVIHHLFFQLLDGMGFAHKKNIIHRDIKPANIMVNLEMQVKIADFGLAFAPESQRLTQTGVMMGTPAYMSFEQLQGRKDLDPRSDIYSIGISLYEALCGTTPYMLPGELIASYELISRQMFTEPHGLRSRGLPISEALEQVVMRCIQKESTARYGSCEELWEELEPALLQDPLWPPERSGTFAPISRMSISRMTAIPIPRRTGESPLPSGISPVGSQGLAPTRATTDPLRKLEPGLSKHASPQPGHPPQKASQNRRSSSHPSAPTKRKKGKGKWIVLLLLLSAGVGAWFVLGPDRLWDLWRQTHQKGTEIWGKWTSKDPGVDPKEPIAKVRNVPLTKTTQNTTPPNQTNPPPSRGIHPKLTKRTTQTPSKIAVKKPIQPLPPKRLTPPPTTVRGGPMQAIPGGRLVVGKGGEPKALRPEVRLVSDFWLDRYEVTVEMYQACVKAGACAAHVQMVFSSQTDPKKPIVRVSWKEAKTYCRWAGKRLPTELEWEKAARGVKQHTYPWGSQKPTCRHANFALCGFQLARVGETQRPQGQSPYKIADLAGNVWEWTQSCKQTPQGQTDSPCSSRSIRGGGWDNEPSQLASYLREHVPDDMRRDNLGFRCAWSTR